MTAACRTRHPSRATSGRGRRTRAAPPYRSFLEICCDLLAVAGHFAARGQFGQATSCVELAIEAVRRHQADVMRQRPRRRAPSFALRASEGRS
jgi:hypothetical protein